MTRLLRFSLLTALLLALAGCSTGLRLAYQNLDRLALWTLDDYVSLDKAQKAAFRREFGTLQSWHRSTQLPLYSADLRSLAAAFEQDPAPREALERAMSQIEAHGERLWQQAQPATAGLLASLRDEQIDEFSKRTRERIDDEEADRADEKPTERRKRWLREQRENLERWTGRLNDRQKQLLEAGWERRVPSLLSPEQRKAQRLATFKEFVTVLATRHEPGLIDRLNANGDEREQERSARDSARDRSLLIELLQACDAPQRQHVRERVLELADDFDALTQSTKPAKSAAASIPQPAA
ncbi:DUF6279 family lipoprotein [Nevskia ramosa]|uniref:DUF6279 family lipoprotein n=1 Tax=Nevskia ramosa TaxID=64002 RepID=UPI0003B6445E|nr:DUF6279 family lipoprotein [Nevskia ramosa]